MTMYVCLTSLLCDILNDTIMQTARITDLEYSFIKVEIGSHDNVVEVAVFVPSFSIPAVNSFSLSV